MNQLLLYSSLGQAYPVSTNHLTSQVLFFCIVNRVEPGAEGNRQNCVLCNPRHQNPHSRIAVPHKTRSTTLQLTQKSQSQGLGWSNA